MSSDRSQARRSRMPSESTSRLFVSSDNENESDDVEDSGSKYEDGSDGGVDLDDMIPPSSPARESRDEAQEPMEQPEAPVDDTEVSSGPNARLREILLRLDAENQKLEQELTDAQRENKELMEKLKATLAARAQNNIGKDRVGASSFTLYGTSS